MQRRILDACRVAAEQASDLAEWWVPLSRLEESGTRAERVSLRRAAGGIYSVRYGPRRQEVRLDSPEWQQRVDEELRQIEELRERARRLLEEVPARS
jgi:hypothetical protein